MKWFDIFKFPKFCKACVGMGCPADETMRRMGYKSAKFVAGRGFDGAWGLSEEEYTWFVLRWS